MNGKIGNHAFENEKLPAIVSDQVSVLLRRGDFSRYGKHDSMGKLGVLSIYARHIFTYIR